MPTDRKRKPLKWDEPQSKALVLVFEGRKSYEQIALDCTTPLRTLKDWIAHPDFQSALAARRDDILKSLSEMGVAYVTKEARIIALSQLAESARCEYEAHPFLTEERPTRNGPATSETFNRDAFECFRGALDDIAKELGQRKAEKPDSDASQVRIIIETDAVNVAMVQVTTEGD